MTHEGKFERNGGADNLEIERKFTLDVFPEEFRRHPNVDIVQGYIDPQIEDGTNLRIRKIGNEYFFAKKQGLGLVRTENEHKISKEDFEHLLEQVRGDLIEKVRYLVPYGDYTIEVDEYKGSLNGLVTAECEFSSVEDSKKFVPPEWLEREVTEDVRFSNHSLATVGIPRESIGTHLSIESGVDEVVSRINNKIRNNDSVVVMIAGGSASGKTSAVSKKILDSFKEDICVLSMDDYYRGKEYIEGQKSKGIVLNFDQPEVLELDLLKKHLEELRLGKTIQKPIYNFASGEREGTEELIPKKIILVEGLFALNKIIKDNGDITVFVDTDMHGRILRRLLRDVQRTGQKPEEILRYFSEVVEPMHQKHIEPTKEYADIVIDSSYIAERESERSGSKEVQLKFKNNLTTEDIRKSGAEPIAHVTQIDYYYAPQGKDINITDELIRVRVEGGKRIFSYKGPRIKSEFRERPKFEFVIDEDTHKAFVDAYGRQVKTITKDRHVFLMNGVVVTMDEINLSGGEVERFIEVRTTDKGSKSGVKEAIEALGLSFDDSIKETYFEMF